MKRSEGQFARRGARVALVLGTRQATPVEAAGAAHYSPIEIGLVSAGAADEIATSGWA